MQITCLLHGGIESIGRVALQRWIAIDRIL